MARKTLHTVSTEDLPSTDHMDRLVAAFEAIAEEIRAVRQTIDRLYDDFSWGLNNDAFRRVEPGIQFPPPKIMALDPLAEDFGERLNGVPEVDQAALREKGVDTEPSRPAVLEIPAADHASTGQRELF